MELVDKPKEKTLVELSGEYTRECFTYGDREYKIRIKQFEIEKLNIEKEAALKRMNELDNEAAALKAKTKAESKESNGAMPEAPSAEPIEAPEPAVVQ